MSTSQIALLASNVLLFAVAFVAFASADGDAMFPLALFAMVLAVVNGVAAYRRGEREPAPRRRAPEADEMDARTVLDIDARLAALERREREMEEAERIQQMVARGQQSAPAADGPLAGGLAPEAGRERA